MNERYGFNCCAKIPIKGAIISALEKGYVREENGEKLFCGDWGAKVYVIDYGFEGQFQAVFKGYKLGSDSELREVVSDMFSSKLLFTDGLKDLTNWQNANVEKLKAL